MRNPALPYVLIAAAAISGCSGLPARTEAQPAAPPSRGTPAELPPLELSGELLYQILEAEIALQRQRFDVATARFVELAEQTRDPRLAEHAARVAIYARDDIRASKAARLWIELDPTSAEARQIMVVAAVRNGELTDALEHMEFLLSSHADSLEDGLKLIASLLSREQDVMAVYRLMGQFVEDRQDSAEAMFAYAHLAMRAGFLQDAQQAVERTLELRPDWIEAVVLHVRVLQLRGRNGEAMELLAQAVERRPEETQLRLMYARLLMGANRVGEAALHYEIVAEQLPENTDVLMTLALIHLQLNRPDEAEEYLVQVQQLGGRRDEVQYYLGWLEESRENFSAALDHYSSVVAGDSFVEARIRMAVLMARQDELADALFLLDSLRDQRPVQEKRIYKIASELLRQAGRNAEAMEVLDEALAVLPGDTDLLYSRALLAEEMGRLDIAERDLRSIIERDPNNVDGLNALGYTLADRTDRYQEALRYIQRALELAPQNHAVLDSMGWVLYRLGEYEEAVRYLRRSLEIRQDHEVAAHLGEVLWVSGQRQEAVNVWEQALERFPGDQMLLEVMKRFGQ